MISHDHDRRFAPSRLSSAIGLVGRLALLSAIALAPLGACGGGQSAGAVEYSVSAQKNYDKGLEKLKDKDWVAAAKYFAFIKSRFPYSKYAVLSELRIADAEFGAEQYVEAIDSYKLFVKFHPTHEMVVNGYASFRVGEAYYKMLPGDFWLVPPKHEKDQSSTEDAADELKRFLDKYPDSPYRKQAKEIVEKVARRLAAHEWYVASYYWDRDKPMGTVLRLRRLLDRYRGVGYDEEALFLLGRAYAEVGLPDRARATWQELIDKHASHKRAAQARESLGDLPASTPSTPDGPKEPPPSTAPPATKAKPSEEPGAPTPTDPKEPAPTQPTEAPEPSTPGALPPPGGPN